MNKEDIDKAHTLFLELERLDYFFDTWEEWDFNTMIDDASHSGMRTAAETLTDTDKGLISKYVNKKIRARRKELVKELESMGVTSKI